MQQLIQKEGSAHVFNDEATMSMVTQAIIEKGDFPRGLGGTAGVPAKISPIA
jgi:hypothetical protein